MIGILAIDPRTGVISTQVRKPFSLLLPPGLFVYRKSIAQSCHGKTKALRESELAGVLGRF